MTAPCCQSRRHGRRGRPSRRTAALSAESLRRHRGPALLRPLGHRSDRHFARPRPRRDRPRRDGRRLHADPAARQEPVPHPRAHGPRKIQEAILALWLEHKYSKDQILELYLNRVYFGSGAFGVEAAAQRYFGHQRARCSLAEAAMLAGLISRRRALRRPTISTAPSEARTSSSPPWSSRASSPAERARARASAAHGARPATARSITSPIG